MLPNSVLPLNKRAWPSHGVSAACPQTRLAALLELALWQLVIVAHAAARSVGP